jgi:hypothetical protein
MADTYTNSLRIAQQEIGANENTWGTINNAALARLDQAVAGIVGISVAGSNITLSTANNADDEARNAVIVLNGTPGATRTITFPNVEKVTWVYNNTDSTMTLTSGAGSNVDVLAGFVACIFNDGAANTSALVNINARTSGNIAFPATQNASANANTLDDYEEGTWTPGLSFGGGTTGITYSSQTGTYTKIGDRVLWACRFILSNKGSSSGAAQLTGLPFTSNEFYSTPSLSYRKVNLDVASGYYSPSAFYNSATVFLEEQGDNVAAASLTDADFANDSQLYGAGNFKI